MYRKLRKLRRDPIGYCLDSKHGMLRALGGSLYRAQTARFDAVGRANADRKITVIMTAYNTGTLVEAAVQSVLAQSHRAFELMIIDDASTDNTLDVLKKLAATDSRIRVFHSPVNHGTYWSKNWCLSKAESEFVAFHDSDDTSHPLRLQRQLGAIISKKAVGVTCRWQRVDEQGNCLVIDGLKERTAAISLMIRRHDVVSKIGYFDSVRISADTEFIRRIHKVFGVARLFPMRQVCYIGLLRDESLTRGQNGGFNWTVEGLSYVRELSGDRKDYHDTFLLWQEDQLAKGLPLMMEFPLATRKFPAPEKICRSCNDTETGTVQEIDAA
ncbi:glycosyltransferase family 2 protein [Kordiimonas pumila]|uniref:Glycosyltransferase family 2 protein n=1 Tax=Kordiimonas pumila TaxID=2161677 RepID=A0ABV7D3E9_9PROT|nr:glycosyltransferase family 2 protein [Kordiimonas pumila]